MPDLDRIAREIVRAAAEKYEDSRLVHPGLVADVADALRRVEAETREECARIVECDCCDVCGESPGYPKCANEVAADIRAAVIRTSKEGEA